MEQSFGTYTTTQRRAFERDVYDFARALGFSKARAKASMLVARTFCGEEEYDTDDTRLDDDERDDSSDVLVSLPLSTGMETTHSSFARSFSATSPSIPRSGNSARVGPEVLPSVELRETPQSEGGKSKRTRKAAEDPSAGPKGKKRKTDSDLCTKNHEYENGDADAGIRAPHPPALQKPESNERQDTAATEHPQHEFNSKDSAESGVVEPQSTNCTGRGPSAINGEQAKNDQPEKEGQQNSQESSKGKKAKGEKQQSNPIMPPKTPNSGRKKRKRQHSGPKEQSTPATMGENDTSMDGLNGMGDRGALETSSKPHGQNAHSTGVDMNGTAELHQAEEQSDLPKSGPQEEKEPDDAELLLDKEKSALRETKRGKFDQLLEELQVLEAQKKTKKEEGHSINKKELLKSQKKPTEGADKQKGDDGFEVRAQELLRSQNAARRAREEKGKIEDAVDGGKDQPAESKKLEDTALQRKEKKMTKREKKKKKKKRQSEGASSTATGLATVFQSPMIQSA